MSTARCPVSASYSVKDRLITSAVRSGAGLRSAADACCRCGRVTVSGASQTGPPDRAWAAIRLVCASSASVAAGGRCVLARDCSACASSWAGRLRSVRPAAAGPKVRCRPSANALAPRACASSWPACRHAPGRGKSAPNADSIGLRNALSNGSAGCPALAERAGRTGAGRFGFRCTGWWKAVIRPVSAHRITAPSLFPAMTRSAQRPITLAVARMKTMTWAIYRMRRLYYPPANAIRSVDRPGGPGDRGHDQAGPPGRPGQGRVPPGQPCPCPGPARPGRQGPVAPRFGPCAGDQPPMPAQQRLGLDEKHDQRSRGSTRLTAGEQSAFGGLQPRSWNLAVEHGELVAKYQDLEILGRHRCA
jgi:hypothetical protein